MKQNGIVTNSGACNTPTIKNPGGETISVIEYSNSRIKDSATCNMMADNRDSLFFSNDLIGTIGSGWRHYGLE